MTARLLASCAALLLATSPPSHNTPSGSASPTKNTGDNAQVAAWLHAHPVDDMITRNAPVRPDGRVMNDLYDVRAKAPADITAPLDNLQVLSKLPPDTLHPSLEDSNCPLVRPDRAGK